jgi:DHA1 family bicyclomycin/chloramphenicol resistance-like MFS transporter
MTIADTVAPRESTASRARFVIILGALVALGPLSTDAYVPGLPELTRDLHASASAAQLSITTCLLGLAVGQLFAGPLSDALGRRRPLLAGLAVYTIAGLLCAFAPNVWVLVSLRAIQGVGGAFGIVIANAIVRDKHSGAAAARFFALLLLVTGLAPVFAPLAGGQLLRVTSWEGIFIVLAVLSAVMLAVSALGLPETHPVERRHRGGIRAMGPVFRMLLADRPFLGYTLANGLAFGAMFAYISGSPYVLEDLHGLSPQAYGSVFAVNALGLVVAAQVTGRIVGRFGPRRLLAVGLLGSAIGGLGVLAAVVTGSGLWPLLAGLFIVVSSVGLVMPTAAALALQPHGANAGTAAALLGLAQFLIGGCAAPLVGIAGSRSDRPMALVIALLGVSAVAVFAVLTRADRPFAGAPAREPQPEGADSR